MYSPTFFASTQTQQLEDLKRTIRSKTNWEQNLYNDNILATYLTEAIAQGISEETFQKAIERLRSEEVLQAATRSMDGIIAPTANVERMDILDTAATSTNNFRKNTYNNTAVDFEILREQVIAVQRNISKFMDEPLQEKENGVWAADNAVPPKLSELLATLLGSIKLGSGCESNPEVQDIIDPSIYPYIPDVSYMINPAPEPPIDTDYYQWLPAQFAVDKDGRVDIKSYINNLDRVFYPDLYKTIELVFAIFLPMFEKCLQIDLRSRELQVIVKATNFILQPDGEVYEEQWQKEGMPHEHIAASGIYYYSAPSFPMNAGIIFRRKRGSCDYPLATQDLFWERDDIGDENRDMERIHRDVERIQRNILLGAAPMTEGRCLVFPNDLQHKLFIGLNESEKSVGIGKVLRFFLVHPSYPIISSKDVLEQQWDVMGHRVMAALDDVVLTSIGKRMPPEILLEILPWAKSGLTYKEAQGYLTDQIEQRNSKIEDDNHEWDGIYNFY